MKFSTLDSTIIHEDKNGGKPTHDTMKINEVNQEMSRMMGVSPAVLNNVIFCHQEDSCWPLEEGKKLKERFDAIFGTTEYKKAIEKLKNHGKAIDERLKLSKKDLVYKTEILGDQEKKSRILENEIEQRNKLNHEIENIQLMRHETEARYKEIMQKEKQLSELVSDRKKFKDDIKRLEEQIEKIQSKIKEKLDEDEESILEKLQKFTDILKTKENEKQKLSDEIKSCDTRVDKITSEINENKTQIELTANKIGIMQEKIDKRIEEMKNLAEKLNLELTIDIETQSLDETGLNEALKQIKNAIKNEEKLLEQSKQEGHKNDQVLQRKIDKKREEKTEISTNLKSLTKRVGEIGNECRDLKQQIQSIEGSMPALNKLEIDIKKTQENLETKKNENDLDSLEDCKTCLELEKDDLEMKISSLDHQLEKLEKVHQIKTEIEQKQRDLTTDQKEFNRIKNKQNSSIKNLFQSKVIDEKFKENVQNLKSTLDREVRKIKEEIDEKVNSLNRIKTELNHNKKQLQVKRDESQNIQLKIEELCGSRDYLESLNSAQENVNKLNMELAHLKSSEDFYKKYISDIKETPCCPLCHKGLEASEKDDLNDEIQDGIRQLPEKINIAKKKLMREDAKFSKLNSMKSSYDSIAKLEKEIKSLQEQIENNQKSESKLSDQIEDFEMNISEPKSKLEIISDSFLIDMSKLDDSQKRITLKTNEIEDLKSKLPADISLNKSLDEMRNEKRKFTAEMRSKSDEINRLYKLINESRSKIHQLQEQLTQMITKKASLQEKLQGLDRMRIQIKELEKDKIETESQIHENNSKLHPIQDELDELEKEKTTFKRSEEMKHSKMQQNINIFNNKQQEINRLHDQIKNLEEQNLTEKIKSLESEIKLQEKSIAKLKSEKVEKEQKILAIHKELSNQEGKRRNLEDNLDLRRSENEKKETEEKLQNHYKTHGKLEITKFLEDKKSIELERCKFFEKESELKGKSIEVERNIKSKEKELEETRYKFAKKNYLHECYNVTYLEASLSDLKVYKSVLEKAIIKFHQDKMNQINQSIRDYWNAIYRGNDIDYIMIKTSEENEEINKDEKKRTYNYRVIQAKNGGAEIDMRGRCSAGQRVLASLIIRMALADCSTLR